MTKTDNEALVVKDIAEILHIAPNTIHNRKWQARTGCPIVKHGKRLYSCRDDFWAWFKMGTVK